jgi:hypothetical protein
MLPRQRHGLDFETIVTIPISVVRRDVDVKTLLPTREKRTAHRGSYYLARYILEMSLAMSDYAHTRWREQ